MILTLFGYLIQDWQTLQIVLSVIVLCLCAICFFMPESPRWLIASNRRAEAFVVLNKGAIKNNRTFTTKQFEQIFITSSINKGQNTSTNKMGFKTLFQEWYIARNTIILSINFMVCSMSYYGLALNQVNLGPNIYASFALGGLVEMIGYLFAYVTIDHIGRKTVLVACQFVAGISLILGGTCTDTCRNDESLLLMFALIGKFIAWGFTYIYTSPKLF